MTDNKELEKLIDEDYVCEDYGEVQIWTQVKVTVPLKELDSLVAVMSMINNNLMIEDYSDIDTHLLEGGVQQVESTAVDGACGHDMAACLADIEQGEDQQHHIKLFIGFGGGRTEAVGQILEIAGLGGLNFGFVNEEQAENAHADDDAADDGEDPGPAGGFVQVEAHEAAEDHQDGNQRHHGVDAFHSAPVGVVGGVGDPGVEGGVVGAGAEEGHDAVENDHQAHAQGHGIGGHGEDGHDHIHPEQTEAEDARAPDQVSAADQQFPLADPVGQGAHEHRGHRGGDAGGTHHGGDVSGGSPEHLVNEHIEVHIFHDPGHLTHQGKQGQGHPEPGRKFCLHGKTSQRWYFIHYTTAFPGRKEDKLICRSHTLPSEDRETGEAGAEQR